MTTIPVVWACSRDDVPHRGYWDQALLGDVFDGLSWRCAGLPAFRHLDGFDHHDPGQGAVVVVPARMEPDAGWLNHHIAPLPWAIVILTSDEEAVFPWRDITHPNMAVWVQSPHPARHEGIDGAIPVGYPPDTPGLCALATGERPHRWMFYGQITHPRRQQAAQALRGLSDGLLLETATFTAGADRADYLAELSRARIAPCPAGPQSPDTFRMWEALEAGCVPIADCCAGERDLEGDFWPQLAPPPPFPIVDEWADVGEVIARLDDNWAANAARAGAWWATVRRNLATGLTDTIASLHQPQAPGFLSDLITVVMPTSPIESHPSTAIVNETLGSLTESGLGDCEVLLCADGVRTEQAHLAERYAEYLEQVVSAARRRGGSLLPVIFDAHEHQARMTRRALELVRTPLVLFVEHDCPLDGPIDWWQVAGFLLADEGDVVRFYHEAVIQPEHEPLMVGPPHVTEGGLAVRRTVQWSQRPHLARTDYYRRILDEHFDPDERWMIEDRMHSVVESAWADRGEQGWAEHRLWLHVADGPTGIRRSRHLDARGSQPKWVDS